MKWQSKTLGEIADFKNGLNFSKVSVWERSEIYFCCRFSRLFLCQN